MANLDCVPLDQTAVITAAIRGHEIVVRLFLQYHYATVSGALLHLVVQHGWIEIVKLAVSVQDEGHLNWVDTKSGNTALHIAIQTGYVGITKILLDAGANPNLKNGDGLLPFTSAMALNGLDIVRALLASDTDIIVDGPDKAGVTPLLRACREAAKSANGEYGENGPNIFPVIHELLGKANNKVNLDAKWPETDGSQGFGRTPLHYAALLLDPRRGGDDSLITLLLEHGANPNVRDDCGNTSLFLAVQIGHLQAARKLLDFNVDPNARNHEGQTAIHWASQDGNADCIEELVTRGAFIDAAPDPKSDDDGLVITPLITAIVFYQQTSVEKLLDLGCSLGRALHMGSGSEIVPIAKALFEHYPDPNLYDEAFGTPLHSAVMSNSEEMVKFILSLEGVDVNSIGPAGRTPLSCAVTMGQRIVECLIQAHADPNIKDNEGKTPLDHAIAGFDSGIAEILCRHTRLNLVEGSVRRHSALYRACQTIDEDIFNVVNAASQNLNHFQYIELCELALHASIASGEEEFFNQLINVAGVTGSLEDDDGWTPLKYAICYDRPAMKKKILKRLRQNGTDRKTYQGDKKAAKMPRGWHQNDRHPSLYQVDEKADPTEVTVTAILDEIQPAGADRYAVARADHPIPTDENYYFEITIKKGCPGEKLDMGIGLIDGATMLNKEPVPLGSVLTYDYQSLGGCTYSEASGLKNNWELSREYRQGSTVGCGFDATKKCVYFTWEGERLEQSMA
ncbi:Ankyrin repeat-containing domain protein [Fusarium austroafricanum]|uniref:Ankyrin repeat-containing domain protein n=1 Tax=Fusarium austroafricanum TaxID=2364996 RepID=A0A8H4KE21_9HYPO|nr:Ankyrin repeat-containing domain protein [Fusarium austroafricanum]